MSYEYHKLLQYVYFEGYADSYEEAEYLLEELSDEEFYDLYEGVFSSRSSGAASADAAEKAAEMHKTASDSPNISQRQRKKYRDAAARHKVTARRKRKKEETNEEFVIDYLVTEGYTDNYDSAVEIYESMSDEWLYTILEVKGGGKVPFTGDTRNRGMVTNPSDKLYRKKIKVEMDIDDEEENIKRKNKVKDHDEDHDEYDDSPKQSKKSQRKQSRRSATAEREIRTSPKLQKLQKRVERMSDVDDRMRGGR